MFGKLLLAALISFGVANLCQADEFQSEKIVSEKINCTLDKGSVQIHGTGLNYKIYEKAQILKLTECRRLTIAKQTIYTFQFESLEVQSSSSSKLWILEVAVPEAKGRVLNTQRSEIIDRIKLGGDQPEAEFENSLKTEWGTSKKDHHPMLKIEISSRDKREATNSYLLKQNPKKNWFENVF